jgi:ABC-2 type transport system ATP-binding protein
MNGSTPVIRLEAVNKYYSDAAALTNLSMCVHGGSVFGLLGPNGAGKTTALRAIMGLLSPSGGRISIGGVPVDSPEIHRARKAVGYVPDESYLYDHLTAREFLTFIALLRGRGSVGADQVDNWIQLLDLTASADHLVGVLSLGTRRKIAFLAAMLGEPRVLVLDEPTAALDAASANLVGRVIEGFRDRGAAVLLATHQMDLAERLCDRIGILYAGTLLFEGSQEDLRLCHGIRPGERLEEIFLRMTASAVPPVRRACEQA